MKISSKQEFIQLYIAGVLGNRFDIFLTVDEYLQSNVNHVGFRELGTAGGGKFIIVERPDVLQTALQWTQEGRRFYLNAGDMMLDKHRLIQGELCYDITGWKGFIGPSNGLTMREGMKAGLMRPTSGAATRAIMRSYMDNNTIDDIDLLLDLYPESTIEFTTYSCDVGILNNRNTIIWEVRDY